MPYSGEPGHILGLDLGTTSVGWCLVNAAWDEESTRWRPVGLEAMGVRIFEAGVEGDISTGKDESRGVKRRQARGTRRSLDRRAGRMHSLFLELVRAGFLPEPNRKDGPLALRIHEAFQRLDDEFVSQGADPTRLPYHLREKALAIPLLPQEIGRALYHLAQRRGFKSNRRAPKKDDEKLGVVAGGIKSLKESMGMQGAQTLGSFFAKHDPEDHRQQPNRIRGRYTHRDMVREEFDAIWDFQKPHHLGLMTQEAKSKIEESIFFQRPLKSSSHLIGFCSLEQGAFILVIKIKDGKERRGWAYKAPRRAPVADPLAQRFRLLQKANDARIELSDGTEVIPSTEQRLELLRQAEDGDIQIKKLKAAWGLKVRDKINLGEGSETKIPGLRTAEKIRGIIGSVWDALGLERQRELVQLLRAIEDSKVLERLLITRWSIPASQAGALATLELEDKYLGFSIRAIQKLLPHLEDGIALSTAIKEIYGTEAQKSPLEKLPRVAEAMPQLRNPMVSRTLTELRKVVNAVAATYGKPVQIRIELARDMKKGRDARAEISKRNRERGKVRNAAKVRLIQEAGIAQPKARDVEKLLLAEECGWVCPYSEPERGFGMGDLMGQGSPIDIEHIIPFSRSLDDSFANKTLCWADENRNAKHNKLPMEAYGHDRMAEILGRVANFKGDFRTEKLRRFRQECVDQDFTSSQLNDTAYASKLAGQYLSLLYGGLWDDQGLRILNCKGQMTATLRREWKLDQLLGGGEKNRGDLGIMR